jgi:hypothetical protein
MKDYLRLQDEVHNCNDDDDCTNARTPDSFLESSESSTELTYTCMDLVMPKFEASYCLPTDFCNKSLTVKGKSMEWVCESAIESYKLGIGALVFGLIS